MFNIDFPLSRDQVTEVHAATVEVLRETGFRFACEKVRNVCKRRGLKVSGGRVYFTEKDILRALETVPKTFTIRARNEEHNIEVRRDVFTFGMGRTAVTIVEPDGSYRSAVKSDVIDALKLGQSLPILEHVYPFVDPCDVDGKNVHLWVTQAAIEYSDKPYNCIDRHDIDLIALAYGTSKSDMSERNDLNRSPGHATAIINSPLTISQENCDNLMAFIEAGMAFHIASMPVACISGPATAGGTIVLQNCENLAPLVFSQLLKPGCPVFYGALAGHANMMSLRPLFGTPEARILERAGNQMAGFYGLSCRGNIGLTDAPGFDFQSGAQAMLSATSVLEDGPNFLTGCGLLGSYRSGSLAKIILDTELLELATRYFKPIDTDGNSLAVDVIRDVGPEGTFIQHDHTLRNYRKYIHTESLFHYRGYESLATAGTDSIPGRAHEKALKILESYEKPSLDQGLKQAVDEYVARNWEYS